MQPSLSASPVALTVEIPFSRTASGTRPPQPLSRQTAEDLAETIGRDLQRLLGEEIYQAGMIVVGALYDIPELLQPGLPSVDALTSIYRDAMPPTGFEPSLLAIGGHNGRFPIPAIAPTRQPGAGPLLILPLVLVGPSTVMDRITPMLEEKLLHTGQAGLDTTRAIQRGFDIQPENLTYATFNDLCALMKVQMDHGGFGPLWNLTENALFQRTAPSREVLPEGNCFLWQGGEVSSPFYTLRAWLSGEHSGGEPGLEGYLQWLRRQRQYAVGLAAHGIPIFHTQPDPRLRNTEVPEAVVLAGDLRLHDQRILAEERPGYTSTDTSPRRLIAVEHAVAELGPIAFTLAPVSASGEYMGRTDYYPLHREAIAGIREHIAERGRELQTPPEHRRIEHPAVDPDSGELHLD